MVIITVTIGLGLWFLVRSRLKCKCGNFAIAAFFFCMFFGAAFELWFEQDFLRLVMLKLRALGPASL